VLVGAMTLLLTFSTPEAEPYRIGGDFPTHATLAEAIEEESHTVASEADADHLEDPSEETREAFRLDVVRAATLALQRDGDTYVDPTGVRWTLREEQDR